MTYTTEKSGRGLKGRPEQSRRQGAELVNWNANTCEFLILRVLRNEHKGLRDELRDLRALATSVEQEGRNHPQLKNMQELTEQLSTELIDHMKTEESTLFPALLELELAYVGEISAVPAARDVPSLLKDMSGQHRAAERSLAQLWKLSNGFHPPRSASAGYREFNARLTGLHRGLRHDLEIEDDVLFARVARMAAELARGRQASGSFQQ